MCGVEQNSGYVIEFWSLCFKITKSYKMQACRKALNDVSCIHYQEITAICRQNGCCKCKIFLNLDDNISKNQINLASLIHNRSKICINLLQTIILRHLNWSVFGLHFISAFTARGFSSHCRHSAANKSPWPWTQI